MLGITAALAPQFLLFVKILLVAEAMKIVKIGNISLDGTKIKADANNNRIIEKETLDKLSKYIDKVIEDWKNPNGSMETLYEQIDDILVIGVKI